VSASNTSARDQATGGDATGANCISLAVSVQFGGRFATKSEPGAVATSQKLNADKRRGSCRQISQKTLSFRPVATAPGSDFVVTPLNEFGIASELRKLKLHHYRLWRFAVPVEDHLVYSPSPARQQVGRSLLEQTESFISE
jgi:hypothetical protein